MVGATSILQTGLGVGQAVGGHLKAHEGEFKKADARKDLEDTRYADYNQSYYDELQRRSNVGLQDAQRQYMEQNADRAVGASLAASEDRRGGLIGVGRAQAGLSQAYRDIGMADVAERQRNAQMMLDEMNTRGSQTYQEKMQLGQLDYAAAEQMRQEGLSQQQAGMQTAFNGASNMATSQGGGMSQPNVFGGSTQGTPIAPQQMNTGSFTYNTNPTLSTNNSPFYNGTQGMSGYGGGLGGTYNSGI